MSMHHIVNCGLSSSTVFFNIILETEQFLKKVIEHKMCVYFLYNFCLQHFSF